MNGSGFRARKCAMLSVALLLAVGLMSAPASAQADEDKGLSAGALSVLLITPRGPKPFTHSARRPAMINQHHAAGHWVRPMPFGRGGPTPFARRHR
jgi:hypothetical protein